MKVKGEQVFLSTIKSNTNILLIIVTIGALLYSGIITILAYNVIIEDEKPSGTGEISVTIFVFSTRVSDDLNWAEIVVVDKGASAYDALSSIANITTKDYPMGKYLEGINGVIEEGGYYWFFYYWDFDKDAWELSPMGISSLKVSDGDFLQFKFEDRSYP